ncbi:MAG: TatD family hydrolase [Candidatus Xenobia bacterium]
MLIDTHIHLDAKAYHSDWTAVLDRAVLAGVAHVVAPATTLESARRLLEMASQDDRVRPAVGVHPHEASSWRDEQLGELSELVDRAVAVGEIGLDFHYDFAPPEQQLGCLRAQLELAREHALPVILHCREAEETLYEELSRARLPAGGVVHCFTGGWKWAERFLELGYFLGITGMVTFPKLTEVHEVARRIPLDRLLLETDGPYLAPIPFRGKRNEPGYVPLIARKVAELRAIDPEQVALATSASATRLFARQ